MKVVHHLGSKGFVITTRGKGGGLALQHSPETINIGDVVRNLENHFNGLECIAPTQQHCRLLLSCGLKYLFIRAWDSYLEVQDFSNPD